MKKELKIEDEGFVRIKLPNGNVLTVEVSDKYILDDGEGKGYSISYYTDIQSDEYMMNIIHDNDNKVHYQSLSDSLKEV